MRVPSKSRHVAAKKCGVCGNLYIGGHGAVSCHSCYWHLQEIRSKVLAEVAKAVKHGDLPPVKLLVCVDCGAPAKHYDHRYYGKPLIVEPVCVACNRRRGRAIDFNEVIMARRAPELVNSKKYNRKDAAKKKALADARFEERKARFAKNA